MISNNPLTTITMKTIYITQRDVTRRAAHSHGR